jgi:hypothetical protein
MDQQLAAAIRHWEISCLYLIVQGIQIMQRRCAAGLQLICAVYE